MKGILITAVYYPPCELIGAKRPFKIAKFLSESGWDVTVLTVEPGLTPPIGRLEADKTNIKTIRTKAFVPYIALRNRLQSSQGSSKKDPPTMLRANADKRKVGHSISSFLKYLARKSSTSFDQIDNWSGWRRSALRAMKKKDLRFDVVLSTIPPHSTAYLGMQLAAYYDCKFVLDYRDPWSELIHVEKSARKPGVRKQRQHVRIEDECLKFSDLVLTVSPAITEMLTNRVDKKILTIPQGFVGEISKAAFDKASKYMLYAGSLAYGRDLSRVLLAIKHYVEAYDKRLKLICCGVHPEIAFNQARSVDATDYIDIRGAVQEEEAAGLARKSLCNIVIVSEGYEYSYPGKVFELITAGRPIYVISSKESEAGKLVEEYGIGYSIVGNNPVDFANKIKNEISRNFVIPNKVNELRAENIYRRMIEEGLNAL